MQTIATSVVAALPAGTVLALGILVLLNYSENVMKSMVLAATLILTLVLATVLTLMPFGLAIFGGRKASSSPASSAAVAEPQPSLADDAEGDIEVSDGEVMVEGTEDDQVAETVDFDQSALQTEVLNLDDDEVNVFEEETPPDPKKKKR